MTEKRFTFVCDDESCFFKDDNKVLYCYEVVELLNELHEENQQLKSQLCGNSEEGVCIICKYYYLVEDMYGYYIGKCEKKHEECSKEAVRYCNDFRLNNNGVTIRKETDFKECSENDC